MLHNTCSKKKKIDLTSISTLIFSRFSSFRRVALEACERDGTGYAPARAKRTVPFGAIVNSLPCWKRFSLVGRYQGLEKPSRCSKRSFVIFNYGRSSGRTCPASLD